MKKFGFTLAEVLITLGIIGVVAALTAPALTKNTGSAKIGPTLAKFTNTFETAAESLMHDEGVSSFSEAVSNATSQDEDGNTITNGSRILSALMKYMIMSPYSESYTIYNADGTAFGNVTNGSTEVYQLKDGSIAVTQANGGQIGNWSPDTYDRKGSYKGARAWLIYDINGPKGTNKIGKEVFAFVVDNSGVLVPYGSNAYKYLTQTTDAQGNAQNSFSNDDFGFFKTGQIADNGWKVEE